MTTVSRMGHKISRIKSSCELFYGLIWNSSHFLHVFGITPNVLLIVSVYRPVCTKETPVYYNYATLA